MEDNFFFNEMYDCYLEEYSLKRNDDHYNLYKFYEFEHFSNPILLNYANSDVYKT